MNDHVAVLRRLRDMEEGAVQDAIEHAIATCEQHAALVARLGELEKAWRQRSHDARICAIDFDESLRCADDLARVVKENEGD